MKLLFGFLAIAVSTGYEVPEGAASQVESLDQCTAILVSKEAAALGVGSMTTHTNDCLGKLIGPPLTRLQVD